jgi:hypothetical protein
VTPEQITEAIYTWLMRASRIEDLPVNARVMTWAELNGLEPGMAAGWREGVARLLESIGAHPDEDEHLNFRQPTLPQPPLPFGDADDEEAGERRITPDDN